ncbi:MAG TPA: DUF1934 domain-containing protein [Stenomitos sp.]
MKHNVTVRLQSCQLDAEGQTQRTENEYAGTWYQQGPSDYLVYQEDGVQTTLKWDPREWRLFRRGADIQGWQVFRLGESLESDISLQGSYLPLTTYTKRLVSAKTETGLELQLEYTLFSGPDLIGNFTLIIHLTIQEEASHG